MKKVGIVILNYNDSNTVIKLLNKIDKYKLISNIVVVDNCSTDTSYEKLKCLDIDRYEVIKTSKNKGYAYGNNFGSQYIMDKYDVDYIIIANPDVQFEEDLLEKIINYFQIYNDYSLLSAIAINGKGETQKSYWKMPGIIEDVLECTIVYRKLKKIINCRELKNDDIIKEVEVVLGSFFVIKSSILKKIGFLDEGTFLFYEENILGKKLKNENKKLGVIMNMTYIHNHSTTIRKAMKIVESHKIYLESKMYYEKKYNNINNIQIKLLELASMYSVLEIKMILTIKRILKI